MNSNSATWKKAVLIFGINLIFIIAAGVFRISTALEPLNKIYGDNLDIEWKTLHIENILYEPIIICGTLIDSNFLSHIVKREFVAWGDENERWVYIEGSHTLFYKIQGSMCK